MSTKTKVIISSFFILLGIPQISRAEIQSDRTLGKEFSKVLDSLDNTKFLIQGGAARGRNLFHSFDKFNILNNTSVHFSNPLGIQHIFVRVTGNRPSRINGILGIDGLADLYFINPNGISFGANSQLDLSGSFFATTARKLVFNDGFSFNADPNPNDKLLSIKRPKGLLFTSNPGDIVVQSQAFRLDQAGNFLDLGLTLKENKSFSLIGGEIIFDGGSISVPRGNIKLHALNKNSYHNLLAQNKNNINSGNRSSKLKAISFLRNNANANLFSLGLPLVSTVDSNGLGGGSIEVSGNNITLRDGSQIVGSGAEISVNADNKLEVIGTGEGFPSAIASIAPLIGRSKDVQITSKFLNIQDGGRITSETGGFLVDQQLETSSISAGNLIIDAESIFVNGTPETITGFFSSTFSFGSAGNISIRADSLFLQDESSISLASTGLDLLEQEIQTGAAGTLDIDANLILLKNQASINGETISDEANINLNTKALILFDDSQITTNATNAASGGNINVKAGLLLGRNNSDITANATEGLGGTVQVTSNAILGFKSRTRDELFSLLDVQDATNIDPSLLSTSDISAISQLGGPSLQGNVNLQTINVNPNVIDLQTSLIDPAQLISKDCLPGDSSQLSYFRIYNSDSGMRTLGRINDTSPISHWISLDAHTNYTKKNPSRRILTHNNRTSHSSTVIEANTWKISSTGDIALVSQTHPSNSTTTSNSIHQCSRHDDFKGAKG